MKDNKTESTPELNSSQQKPSASSQPGKHGWSGKESATNVEIIAKLQSQDSSIAQNVIIGPTEMSYLTSYGSGPYLNWMTIERDSRRAFLFHTAL